MLIKELLHALLKTTTTPPRPQSIIPTVHEGAVCLCDSASAEVNMCLRCSCSDDVEEQCQPQQCWCLVSNMLLLCNTWMKNAQGREREKTTSLEARSFWQRVKGKLPRYYFSLSWHEAEAGKWRGGAVGCVRQQARLGLPCQEVGRACGSYLIYGRAGAQGTTHIQQAGKEEERVRAEDENALTPLLLLTSFIHPACGWVWAYACEHTYDIQYHTQFYMQLHIFLQPKVLIDTLVREKVSNEENARATAVPSIPHGDNTAAQTCKLTPHTW